MDASIPKFRNESLSKIDVVLHHLCTNPHNEHKPHNDSAQNCQFPWGSVTHMSGHRRSVKNCQRRAPTERQYALLHPWTDCYVLGTVPLPCRTTRRTVATPPAEQ